MSGIFCLIHHDQSVLQGENGNQSVDKIDGPQLCYQNIAGGSALLSPDMDGRHQGKIQHEQQNGADPERSVPAKVLLFPGQRQIPFFRQENHSPDGRQKKIKNADAFVLAR